MKQVAKYALARGQNERIAVSDSDQKQNAHCCRQVIKPET